MVNSGYKYDMPWQHINDGYESSVKVQCMPKTLSERVMVRNSETADFNGIYEIATKLRVPYDPRPVYKKMSKEALYLYPNRFPNSGWAVGKNLGENDQIQN